MLPPDLPEEPEPDREVLLRDRPDELEPLLRDRPEELEPDRDFDVEPEVDLEREPELVFDDPELVFERELVFEPLEPPELFVFDVEPLLREREAREVLEPERPREPDDRDEPPPDLRDPPPPPPSSPESSSESFDPSSFLPTPTAAAVARPTAAPVATFFGVESPSDPSSSAAIVNPPSPR